MKKTILTITIITTLLLFVGCAYNIDMTGDYNTLDELTIYVYDNIDYLLDADGEDFQSPKETDEYLLGDCEDFTTTFMFLARRDFDIKPDMQIVFISGRGFHALAYHDSVWYDATNNYIFTELPDSWHKIIRWNYDFIMIYATNFYTKNIQGE